MRIYLLLLLLITGCGQIQYQETRDLMDTYVTVTVVAEDQKKAQAAIDAAFDEMRRIEDTFTIHRQSPIYDLNREGVLPDPDEEIVRMFRKAKFYAGMTNGSFDITVQPILDLYEESFAAGGPPTEEQIQDVLRNVDYRSISIDDDVILIPVGMKVTFGGIVKGYAIDAAIDTIMDLGITSALVNAGGDMRGMGEKPDGTPWQIALANPDDPADFIEIISIHDQAVATSGNYERYFDENRSFHHIVDPKTGKSADTYISVTIISPTAIQADTLATGIFVMGPDGLGKVERLDGVEFLTIDSDRMVTRSSGFRR